MPRETSLDLLHPTLRHLVIELQSRLAAEGIPLAPYETARSPFRQAELYARGRSIGPVGHTVTDSPAWHSFHQYGCAVDMVFHTHGTWSWAEPVKGMWQTYRKIAMDLGLRSLFPKEQPHVELPLRRADLEAGRFPDGGDDTWRHFLEQQAELWGSSARIANDITHPGAPPGVLTVGHRPPFTT